MIKRVLTAPASTAEATPSTDAPDLLTPAEAAKRLGVTSGVLERWRGTGSGPAYVRMSAKSLRYRIPDLDAFVASRIVTSTAQPT